MNGAATPRHDASMRVVAVLDGAGPSPERDARTLGGFLKGGLTAPGTLLVTLVFCASEVDQERLVSLAPTETVRPVRIPPHRPDLRAAALSAFTTEGGADLFVFPGGPSGIGQAARLAARTRGGVATAVRTAAVTRGGLVCSRPAYSGHLVARVLLRARPWCVTVDASWEDAGAEPPSAHLVQAGAGPAVAAVGSPFDGLEVLEESVTSDLEAARFLVIAGRGAGRAGVQRIAAAVARMGAAFGITRPVAMNGWAPVDRLVGVSGARTAPAVCITAGVHGAPALLWGIEGAAFIAGVDLDAGAPIAAEADVVVIGDAVAVIEALADLIDTPEHRT